jgi:hypothetical protein
MNDVVYADGDTISIESKQMEPEKEYYATTNSEGWIIVKRESGAIDLYKMRWWYRLFRWLFHR